MTSSLPFVPERVTFDTAAAHACTQVPIATPTSRIGDIHQALVGQRYESATHIVVCDAGKFCGILRLEDVLAAPPDTLASTVMDTDPPVVAPGVDQEVAAWRAVQHAESALAVVDAASRFVGLIPPHRLLAVLLSEHEEDLSRLGGFLKNTSMARHTSEEAILHRF